MTARELITDVLQDIGKHGVGDTLSNEDAQFVFRRLNQWIDALALERMLIYFYLRTVYTLAANTASYTIGTAGTINIVRPQKIEAAGIILDSAASPVSEVPISVFTDQEWQRISQKDLTSTLSRGVYYDRGWSAGLGRLYPWPVPTVGTTRLVIYSQQALAQFADLTTPYTFPPGYELFLRTGLAAHVAGGFGKTLTSDQVRAATRASAMVKRGNDRHEESEIPSDTPGFVGGGFDYRTGETR